MKKKNKITPKVITHNYIITNAYGDYVRPLPEPESYPNLKEAAKRSIELLNEMAVACFPPRMPKQDGAISLKIKAEAKGRSRGTVTGIIREFNKCPSVRLSAEVYFWGTYWTHIEVYLQGVKELAEYNNSDPSMVELSKILKAIGAKGTTANGIVLNDQ